MRVSMIAHSGCGSFGSAVLLAAAAQPSVLSEVAAVADQPVEEVRSGLRAPAGCLMGVLGMITLGTG
jgi:hypothetical protein